MKKIALTLAVALIGVTGAHATEGDVAEGKKVFRKCQVCHVIAAESKARKLGPNLYGFLGREAGTIEGYKYSKAMQDASFIWSEEIFREYIKNPRKYVKGTKMAFPGLRKEEEIDNILAYMKANGAEVE